MTNLAHNLSEVAAACADRTAIKLDEIELSYTPSTPPRRAPRTCCAASASSPATASA